MVSQDDIFRSLVKLNAAETMRCGENFSVTRHNIAMVVIKKRGSLDGIKNHTMVLMVSVVAMVSKECFF